ncbi:MAG: response regulator [Elusimicrobia bacterium]|nr:response regulator [Elusimicrobiota bacterium]
MARILVVDDEETVRELVRMVLENAGHSVDAAAGGREALALLRKRSYAVAVVDRTMPLMTGIELIREMRADAAMAGVKVIMCTAAGMVSDVDEALSAGAADYVVKPLDMQALAAKVAKHAAGAPSGGSGLLDRVRRLLP